MPTYKVTDPQSGKVFRLTGDFPPTEQELNEIFGGSKEVGSTQEQVPSWGIRNPNLYGAYGAGGALLKQSVRPMAEATGMIGGALTGGPAGGALGYGIAKKVMNIAETAYERIEKPVETKSVEEELVGSAWDVGSTYGVGKGMDIAAKAIRPIDEKITEAIRTGISKAIRPSVQGKGNAPQVERYYQKAESAVKDIIRNDPTKIPKNLQEFSESVKSTKETLYSKYHSMAKEAGQKGVEVDLEPVISEMRAIGGSPELIRANPTEAQRLLQLASLWERMPTKVSPIEAEKLIANFNQQSKAYWTSPNPGSIHSSANSERIARVLRRQTDEMVSTYEGPGWQDFRDRYGALTSIEKEVTNRSVVDSRKNIKGFFDLTDVFSTGKFVKGLLKLEPVTIAESAAMRLAKWGIKKVNDPNRIVRNMFSDVAGYMEKLPPEQIQAFQRMKELPEPAMQMPMQGQIEATERKLLPRYLSQPDIAKEFGTVESTGNALGVGSKLRVGETGPLKAKYRIGDYEGDITLVEPDKPFLSVPKRIHRKSADETKEILNKFRRSKGLPPID